MKQRKKNWNWIRIGLNPYIEFLPFSSLLEVLFFGAFFSISQLISLGNPPKIPIYVLRVFPKTLIQI